MAPDVLVLSTDAGAGRTDLTGWTLEFGVGTFANAAFASTTAVADLSVLGQAGGSVEGAVTGAACVVGITDARPAFTASMSY